MKYMTKQRGLLTDYLLRHTDESLTAREIAQSLAASGISLSAVYRNLTEMEQEGTLYRLPTNGRREIVYQYRAGAECRAHLHMSCTRCGRTYHMKEPHASRLIRGVARDEGFSVCMEDTVLYGVCAACRTAP